jgi:hypothetical protein
VSERERADGIRGVLGVLLIALLCALPPAGVAAAAPSGRSPMPMTFEPNQGQAEAAVKFLARGRGYGLFLAPTETVLVLAPTAGRPRLPRATAPEPVVVRMRLLGADPAASLVGVEPLPGRSHYLLGPPDQWRRSVPAFARVRYDDVYPGVSLVFYGSERQLEYDFVVAPGADPAAIELGFEGADGVSVDGDGDLVLATGAGELRLHRPLVYQEADGERRRVDGGYVLDGGRVRFRVAAWDATRPLVIDPVLGYSTFLGGSSNDQGLGIAVDGAGNAYVTGSTISSNFPISSVPAQLKRAGVTDAFVTKLGPNGTLVYSTFLGGSGDDAGNAIAVDGAGNAYVAGTTNSTNFPVVGAFQSTLRGGNDAFVAKLDPSGGTLVYSTYLGSNTDDFGNGIAVDGLGNAYVTGSTASAGFPNNGAVTCLGTKRTGDDAFVAKLDASGATVGYCRFVGGAGVDAGQGIAADAAGNVWFVGATTSSDLPVQAAVQPTFGGRVDGFVGKLDPGGAVVYLSYLGGSGTDLALGVAVDATGNAYVTGSTDSADFPTVAPLQPSLAGGDDAFVTKLNPTGSVLVFSTYLGGSGDDAGNGIAVHPVDSSVFVAGSTRSVDFPVLSPIQPALAGRLDAFVARLNAAGGALVFSTYLGGAGDDAAQALAADADGVVYLTGSTTSTTFPTASPIQSAAGLLDAFVTQIAEGGIVQFTASGYQVAENAGTVTLSVQRTGDVSAVATVDFVISDGTASAGADYTVAAATGTLTFAPGQIVATFPITIVDDTLSEGDETVNLTLLNPGSGAVLGRRSTAVLTILDDEPHFTSPTYQVAENRGPALITIARSGSLAGTVTVQFSTTDGTAVDGLDYTGVNRTLTFAPAVRTVTVAVPILNDTEAEGNETVNLMLTSPGGGAPQTAVLTIVDDEPTVFFSAAAFTAAEATATAVVTVRRGGAPTGQVTVDFATADDTAVAGVDYQMRTGTLTFPSGVTTRTLAVPVVNDTVVRGGPRFLVTLTNPAGASLVRQNCFASAPAPPAAVTSCTATVTIVDNDVAGTVQFSQSVYTVSEAAASATITVTRTGGTASGVTVDFQTADGTATGGAGAGPGVDYMITAGTLSFAAGVMSRTFTVPVFADALAEGNETVLLSLSNPTGGVTLGPRSTAQLKILDDEATVQFATDTSTVVEGSTASIVVERTGTAGTVIVPFATSDGTGVAGTDYVGRAGSLTFAAGVKTLAFPVATIANTLADGDRTVNLTLGPAVTGTGGGVLGPRSAAVLTIVDNDVAGALAFSSPSYNSSEFGVVTLTVRRPATARAGGVTVAFATADGTAVAGTDYQAKSGVLTFAAGVIATNLMVAVLPNTRDDGDRSFTVALSAPTGGATLGTPDAATVVIHDDDVAGTVQFGQALYTVGEAATSATITVTRSGGAAGAVTVDFATSDGPGANKAVAGIDYTATATTVTFAASQTTRTVVVPLAGDDGVAEGNKIVTLTLSNPGGGAGLGPRSTAQLKILDDEASVQFATGTYAVAEGSTASIVVERTGTAGTVIVPFATSDGTGVAGTDYLARAGSLTFAAGVKTLAFAVPTIANTRDEGDRMVNLTLGPAVTGTGGAILGPQSSAVLTIVDNDVAGTVQFTQATFGATECAALPCTAVLTLVRSGGAASGVSVDFATIDGTATATDDYVTTTGTVTFAAGQASQVIRIPLKIEPGPQPLKSFSVVLSNPAGGASLGVRTTAEVRITDTR